MNQGALVVLKVSCVMAGDTIPASLCETEQGGTLCSGCRASTRRCAACNQAKGISDARRGLCGDCLAVNSTDTSERRTNAQRLEEASSGLLDLIDQMNEEKPAADKLATDTNEYQQQLLAQIKTSRLDKRSAQIIRASFGLGEYQGARRTYREIGSELGITYERVNQILNEALERIKLSRAEIIGKLGITAKARGARSSADVAPASKQLDPEIALQVLAEHGVIKPSGQYVPNPARVLSMRIGLLPSEAQTAVEALLESGKIERANGDAWRFLTDISDVIRNRDENFTWGGQPTRALARPTSASGTATVSEKSSTTVKRGRPTGVNSQAVYSALLESAQTVDGNMVVRGAIPVLLTRLRVKPHEAIEILEQLQTSGNVRQIDEWRSICLLGAPALPAPEAIAPPIPETKTSTVVPARTRRDPLTGTPVRRIVSGPRKMQPALPVPPPTPPPVIANLINAEPRVEPKVKAPKVASGPTLGDLFDAICRLSTDLGGERLVRAVVPTLSARLSIGIPDIIAAMERLELQKAIQRKDGWRTIVVTADRVEDTSPVKTAAPSARERAEKLNLRVVAGGEPAKAVKPGPASQPAPKQKPRALPSGTTAPVHSVSEELSQLRRTVEELNRTVAALAASARAKTEPAAESIAKAKKSKRGSKGAPKLPKVKNGQHELRWKKELWLTDQAFAERISRLSGSSYSIRKFHANMAPLANNVRVTHALCSDGSISTFYSAKDMLKLFHKKISDKSK